MKILYGVQGTGNGHISRARRMADHLSQSNIQVDFMFSGRAPEHYFDMEIFGQYKTYRGLTFASKNGRLSYTKTALSNNIFRFAQDVRSINIAQYDLVITDFEPISAWAGKLRGKEVIGIGHQYAFGHPIPRAGDNFVSNLTMKLFAPATTSLGLHWAAFDSPILPPIIDTTLSLQTTSACEDKSSPIVVYLPFENQWQIQDELSRIGNQQFIIYSPELVDEEKGNLLLRKTSHNGFKRDLCRARGVICNSGFELISECLHLGLAILTKPQYAQTEQMSNAAALAQLGYAQTATKIDTSAVESWLNNLESDTRTIRFPDVASSICDWLINGRNKSAQMLSDELWAKTNY